MERGRNTDLLKCLEVLYLGIYIVKNTFILRKPLYSTTNIDVKCEEVDILLCMYVKVSYTSVLCII